MLVKSPSITWLSSCVRRILVSPPFTKYLLATNVLFGGAIDFLGDFVAQRKIEKVESMNWERSGRMVTMGVVLGVPAHYWYLRLDRWFPLNTRRHIGRKILLDSLLASPFFITGFFVGEWFTSNLQAFLVESVWVFFKTIFHE